MCSNRIFLLDRPSLGEILRLIHVQYNNSRTVMRLHTLDWTPIGEAVMLLEKDLQGAILLLTVTLVVTPGLPLRLPISVGRLLEPP